MDSKKRYSIKTLTKKKKKGSEDKLISGQIKFKTSIINMKKITSSDKCFN